MTITAESMPSEPHLADAAPLSPPAVCNPPGDERSGPLSVQCVRNADDLVGLRPRWNELAGGIPFRRWEWLATWWTHFRTRQDELLVLTVTDCAGIVGIAPWFARRSATCGRVIHFLGSGLVCSDYATVLHAPSCEQQVAEALASWLSDHEQRSTWIELSGVSLEDPVVRHLAGQLEEREHVIDWRPRESCWRIEFPNSWEEYVGRLSRSRRGRVRQLKRRILDSDRAEIRVADSCETLGEGLDILADLHQKRQTSLGQPGCFALPQFHGFLNEVAGRFFDLGQLRMQWVEVDGHPVVAEIDFLGEHTLYMYQSGMDPDFSEHRPGWLGTIASLHHAIEEGYECYDFLRGDEPYKAHWRAEPQPVALVRAFPKNFRARLSQTLFQVHAEAKRYVNTSPWYAGK